MADTALTTDVSGLITYVKVTLLLAAFLAAVTASQFVLVVLRLKIPVAKLWTILKPSFMVQLASASSSVAFAESYEACERGFGIDRKLVRFALPIGTVMHKPLIAAEFIFIIAAARGADGVGLNTGSLLILMLMAFLLSVAPIRRCRAARSPAIRCCFCKWVWMPGCWPLPARSRLFLTRWKRRGTRFAPSCSCC